MNVFQRFSHWLGVMSDKSGQQIATPSTYSETPTSPDKALQVSTVYACSKLLASTVATLPLMVYKNDHGKRKIDRDSALWLVLHEQPNDQMTPADFWAAMILQWALRGNAYALITRDGDGEVVSLWPLSADQMDVVRKPDGSIKYIYSKDLKKVELDRKDVLHIKDLGTGLIGFSKLEFMSSTMTEAVSTQSFASSNARNFGKPSGVLTVDHVFKQKEQREALKNSLFDFKTGGAAKLAVLEADMKFQQISLTPEQSQLLETRNFGIEEICRWFGVPPALVGASGATPDEATVSNFCKFTLRPLLTTIEQALMSRVLTDAQKSKYTLEFNFDGLLRSDIATRYGAYATAVQNGFMTRNEVRQLENNEPMDNADELTAQTNLAPLSVLGQFANAPQNKIEEIKQ